MKKVLIIEDEIILQDAYRLVLSLQGYDVLLANNGLEGLEKAKKYQPDLILLDFFMPKMDGKEFLRNFNKSEHAAVKIIMYTNFSDSKTEAEMLELGADRYVLKASLSPKNLTDLITEVLASKT